jgi:hypothetical protein
MEDIKPSDFIAAPPKKIPYKDVLTLKYLQKILNRFLYLVTLIINVYDAKPLDPTSFTSANPAGEIKENQLKLCQSIYDETKERDEKLGQKSAFMLSSIAILIPLTVSALFYTRTVATINPALQKIITVLVTFSIIFIFFGFIAAFRALSIRSYDTLYIQSIIDVPQRVVVNYSVDKHARGLLWCATKITAMNDQKADFVRASQLFIALSMIFLLISSMPIIYAISPETKVQKISGNVQVSSESIKASLVDLKNEIKSSHLNSLDAIKLDGKIDLINRKIIRIENEVDELRKKIKNETHGE